MCAPSKVISSGPLILVLIPWTNEVIEDFQGVLVGLWCGVERGNIPSSVKCKIVGQILIDHALSYALTRLEEDYHSIKDDIPLVSVYTIGNVTVRGMLISDEFFTVTSVPPRSIRSMRRRFSGTPRKSLKVTIKQKKLSSTLIPPPSDDRERDDIVEATLLSLTMHKTAIAAKAQENVTKVQEKIIEENIEKMVEGDNEESYASEFADMDDDEKKDDTKDNDNVYHIDHTLVGTQVSGSLETRKEKMQTPISSLPRSHRINLSLDKTITQELTAIASSPTPEVTSQDHSKPTFVKIKILSCSIDGMRRRRGKIRTHLKTTFVTNAQFTTEQQHGLDYMEQIITMKENDKPDSFYEADFKYLNKNDIEDMYYLCQNKKINYR
nr:hypothetical protein [Tanacetum cinerariifolium]